MTTEKLKHLRSWADTSEGLPGWGELGYSQAHERYTLVQVSKRRYAVAHLGGRSKSRVSPKYGETDGLDGHMLYLTYRLVTGPLPHRDAFRVLAWCIARECQAVETLPDSVAELLTHPTEG